MDKLKILSGISSLFKSFFTNPSTRLTSYIAYKAYIYEEIYSNITLQNCKTPEIAYASMNYLCGLKSGHEQIKIQHDLAKKEDSKKRVE